MQFRTRNTRSPQGLQHVYFTGHPEKLEYWREQLIPQILERQNCAVFYESNPEQPEDADNFETDLSRMQLIVIPVTGRFLTQDCFARRVVFAFAMKQHIPVLPILTEPGLADLFNKVCGDLQCLDLTAHDDTALPFGEKLTRYLNSVLIGDETAQKVRNAFDAYIFMSYRKKDRKFAQELMRLIHRNDFCRDIAIWYDEFLVPGESFNDAIQDAIKKSKLFALVVTPSLLEQGNYVMQHEYPDAKNADMKILPAELQKTDRPALEQNYTEIPQCVDSRNAEALAASLTALLADVTNPDNNCGEDPVHDFFIGLAYLGGIDVETNYDTALALITRAAEHELPEAMQKLVDMYNTGEGVQRDYIKAIKWQRKLASLRGKLFRENPSEKRASDWFDALWYLGGALTAAGKTAAAGLTYAEMLRATEICLPYGYGFTRRAVSMCYSKLGEICEAQGKLNNALRYAEKSRQIFEQLAAENGTVQARRDLYVCYGSLGRICRAQGRLQDAQQYFEMSLQIAEQIAAECGTVLTRRGLSVSYSNLGDICMEQGRLTDAQQYYEKSMQIREQLAAENETADARNDLSVSYSRLGNICKAQGRLNDAQQYYEKSLKINEQLAEETGTVEALRNLSVCYEKLGEICMVQGRLPEALQYHEKCLQIREQLEADNGTAEARRDLSVCYNHLGDICRAEQRLQDAREYYEKSLQISELLVEQTGTVETRRDLSICCSRLGDLCKAQGNLTDAQQYYEKCLLIDERIAESTGTVRARRDLSVTYESLGSICEAQDRLTDAQQYYENSLQIREQLAAETGTVEARRDLSVCYLKLGAVSKAQGRLPQAQQYYENSIQLREQLAAETGTREARRDLSVSYERLGTFCEEQERLTQAQQYYEKSLQIAEQLAAENGTVLARRDLAASYIKLGDIFRAQGRLQQAQQYYEKSLPILQQIAEETGTVQAWDDVATSHYSLGYSSEDAARRKAHLTFAYEIWKLLSGQCPNNREFARRMDLAKRKLEEL